MDDLHDVIDLSRKLQTKIVKTMDKNMSLFKQLPQEYQEKTAKTQAEINTILRKARKGDYKGLQEIVNRYADNNNK